MKWIKVENKSEKLYNHYYVTNDTALLVFKERDEILCRLPNGMEKNVV